MTAVARLADHGRRRGVRLRGPGARRDLRRCSPPSRSTSRSRRGGRHASRGDRRPTSLAGGNLVRVRSATGPARGRGRRGRRSGCGAGGAPGGRPPRTSASPGACGPRGSSARSGPARGGGHGPERCGRRRARPPRARRRARRGPGRPRPRPRRPCRPRSADGRAGGRAAPSFVSRSAPVVSASRRPTGTTRGSTGTRPDDGRPPVRVTRGRDRPGRLVQEPVGELLLRDRPAVDLDRVARADERVQLARLPVHADAAGLDQLVGTAPRGDARTSEVGVEPHGAILTTFSGRSQTRPGRSA